MKYKKRKTIRNIILAAVITIAILALVVCLNDFEDTLNVLQQANGEYIWYSVIFVLAYFLLYPIPLCLLTKHIHKESKFWRIYIIGTTEHFFNYITPFATGGQPFQAYAMKKTGVPVRESTGILLMNYIVFMLVTNTFAIISLYYYRQFTENISNLTWIVIIGFSLNFLVLILFFVMAYSRHFRDGSIKLILKITRNKKKIKEKGEREALKVAEYFSSAQRAAQELLKSPMLFLSSFLIKAITMAIYYAVPFFIIVAMVANLSPEYLAEANKNIFYIMAATSFASTIVVWVPTPGASGGIEFAFQKIFSTVPGITSAIAMSSMLIWRLITYYGVAIFSCLGYFVSERVSAKLDLKYNNIEDGENDTLELTQEQRDKILEYSQEIRENEKEKKKFVKRGKNDGK
ncbi:MAG: lysylphosphatidylglycerol synthase transmembrane domain-containing protein [Bacilli bacterium]